MSIVGLLLFTLVCFGAMFFATVYGAINAFSGRRKIMAWSWVIATISVILMLLVVLFHPTSPLQIWLKIHT